ncbi:FHA domain-containing protein [Clostridium sp. BSD9I1]|uniref:FHA domain-containing protein n=1 Tax=Clostridium sp. BSD9I1 TaxID=2003589 RepID=UPI001644168E|nr:FHA domain-containing protein [Clostridium sp. BSD9I1]
MTIGIILVLIGIVGIGTVVGFLVLRKYDEDDFIEDDDFDEDDDMEENKNENENGMIHKKAEEEDVKEIINEEDANIEKRTHKDSKSSEENNLLVEKQATEFDVKREKNSTISDDTIILSNFYNNIIAFLVQLNGVKRGTNYEIKPGESHIGRSDENDIILEDMYVSGNHAIIKQQEDKMYIYDLGSKNGVFVNGEKIEESKELNNNDTIIIGETKLRFVVIQ